MGLDLFHDAPDWDVRSVMQLAPGRYRMRNGHTAIVLHPQSFPSKRISDGKAVSFVVWFGRCEECGEGCSWNANGTYAANGRHGYDIVGAA